MYQFLAFITFTIVWSLLANLFVLIAHPLAAFAVWAIGFVWGTAFIFSDKRQADLLTKRYLQMGGALIILIGMVAIL